MVPRDVPETPACPHSSVLPGDSASQSSRVDVDVVGLTAAVMRPFEVYLASAPGLTLGQFDEQHGRCMSRLSEVLSVVLGPPPVGLPVAVDPPPVPPLSTTSRASSRRRRRAARRAARASESLLSSSGSSLVRGSSSSVSGYLSVTGPVQSVLTNGYCYLALGFPAEALRLRRCLGPSPTVAKLLAAPSRCFDVSKLSSHSMSRSADGEWHVFLRTDEFSPSVSTVLRRFMCDVMISIDFLGSRWAGTLASVLLKFPEAVGSFDLPCCDDRVGAWSPLAFPHARLPVHFSELPAYVRTLEDAWPSVPEGYARVLLFRMYLDVFPSLASAAEGLGLGSMVGVVGSLAADVDLAIDSVGGLGVFARYTDRSLALVRCTDNPSTLAAYYVGAGAAAGSLVADWASRVLPVFDDGRVTVDSDREAMRVCNRLVLRVYSLVRILVSLLLSDASTREACELAVGRMFHLFNSLLSPSGTLGWLTAGSSFRLFAPFRVELGLGSVPSPLPAPDSEAVSVALSGLTVCVLPAWVSGLVPVGNFFANSVEVARGSAAAAGLPQSLVSTEFRPVADAVYFCDPRRCESPAFVCSLFSNVRVCLYIVGPYADSLIGRLLQSFWGSRYAVPHSYI